MNLSDQHDGQILSLLERPELKEKMASWFHEKWGISLEAYLESMNEALAKGGFVPSWYILEKDGEISGGLGVIANDFHERKDLAPNVCAIYVEENFRNQGLAGKLLERVCHDAAAAGLEKLYLVTEHDSFYERYGWIFQELVKEEDSDHLTRLYRKDLKDDSGRN